MAFAASVTSYAEETEPAANPLGSFLPLIMLVLLVVVFYFLVIRPQKKQEKKDSDMRNSLETGDEIITIGGIVGTVVLIRDDKVMIETGNDKTKLTILRASIKSVLKDEEETK